MKKILLSIVLFLTMLFVSGCGASVTSQTKFEQDGSGTRIISAVISASDAKNLDGGFYELDLLLEEAAPEGISVGRSMLENGDAVYQISFHFDNITQYNEKIKKITGKEHNATWYSEATVFKSDIIFSERECTYDLISWALEAFKKSKYSKFSSHFTLYTVDHSEVYYNGEKVFSGTKNPSFTINIAPSVKKVSMYSDYTYEGNATKKLVLEFNEGALEAVNIEDAKVVLDAYSKEYKIDLANNTITYSLTGDQIKAFLMSADLECQEEDVVYNSVYNTFQKKYEVKETYNLKEFLSMFRLEYPYIYNYIKVPEVIADSRVSYLQHVDQIPVPEGYDFAGAYRYDSEYRADIYSNQMVDLKNVEVKYQVNKELETTRMVQVEYSKNGCFMTEKELLKYYPNINEAISVSDNGDSIRIVFTTKRKVNHKAEENSQFKLERAPRKSLKHIEYQMVDEVSLVNYLPTIEGYLWNTDRIPYTYQLEIADEVEVNQLLVETINYEKTGTNYVLEGQVTAMDEPFSIDIMVTTVYDLYYFWIIGGIFCIIVALLGVGVWYMRKKEEEIEF